MYQFGNVLTSGLIVELSPAQLVVGVGLLGMVLLSNAKSLLLMWHGRLFSQLARHFVLKRDELTIKSAKHGGASLFAPVVTSSYTPLLDIDYNLHKSNSTFFNDLDDNRTELMLALFKNVVKPQKHGKDVSKPKMFNLGGTSCTFKKAIPPFARYEISSRVLCWDQKWIYVVSHFTKIGSNKPTKFLVGSQPVKATIPGGKAGDQLDRIYATAITKYVFKSGRLTCSPESVMSECGLLPTLPTTEGQQGLERAIPQGKDHENHWSWDDVQAECNRYLEIAQNFASLDQLHSTFVGRSGPALYPY